MPSVTWLVPYLIHLGAMCYLVCFLFREQLLLRIFAICGDVFYTAYFFVAAGEPLWSALTYSSLNIVINVIMIGMIMQDRRHMPLADNDLKLYQSFKGMSPGDFRRLSRIGQWHNNKDTQILTEEGKQLDRLYYILEGDIELRKGERNIPVEAGMFVGEIAFLKCVPASATVIAKPGTHYISWSHEALNKASTRHDGLKQSLGLLLSSDLASKVARS
jgi:Cyclic nucleotide-binding domain